MNKKLQNLSLFLATLLILFIFAEIVVRIIIPAPPKSDPGWNIPSENPTLIYELALGKEGIFTGYYAYVNDYGRRDNHNTAYFNNPKIAFVGDSFTFGQGVSQNETLSQQFEDLYNLNNNDEITALNFGIGGYNLKQEVELIQSRVLSYKPETIFLIYYINDIELRSLLNTNEETKVPLNIKAINFLTKSSRFLAYMKFASSNVLYNVGISNKAAIDYNNKLYEDENEHWNNFKEEIIKLKEIQEDNDVHIYLVIYPALTTLNEKHPYLNIYNKVELEFRKNNINTINLFNALENQDSNTLRANIYDNHPNALAHKISVEYLIEQYKLLN